MDKPIVKYYLETNNKISFHYGDYPEDVAKYLYWAYKNVSAEVLVKVSSELFVGMLEWKEHPHFQYRECIPTQFIDFGFSIGKREFFKVTKISIRFKEVTFTRVGYNKLKIKVKEVDDE